MEDWQPGLVFVGAIVLVFLGLSTIGTDRGTTRLLEDNYVGYQIARLVFGGLIIIVGLGLSYCAAHSLLE